MATLQQQNSRQKKVVLSPEQKKQLQAVQGRMRRVKNQMDFIEILSNFWPLGNMDNRVGRLESEMNHLNKQYQQIRNPFRVQS